MGALVQCKASPFIKTNEVDDDDDDDDDDEGDDDDDDHCNDCAQ